MGSEVLAKFILKNGVFWVVTPCGTRRNNPEDTILHSHRRENLKSYKFILNLGACVTNGIRSSSRIYFKFRSICHKWDQKF
jgi:hypothetical protein